MRDIQVKSGNGESIRGALFEPSTPGPHPVIILVHGFLSCHAEFGDYPERFCARGYLVLAIDLRGHGESDGMRGFITEDRIVEDVLHALDFVAAHPAADTKRMALFGHSLGGAAVICAAARDARVRAVVAGATACNLQDEVGSAELKLYHVVNAINKWQQALTGKSLYFPYKYSYKHLFADPAAVQAAAAKGFLMNKTPIANLQHLGEQDTLGSARKLQVPVLVIRPQFDRAVKLVNTRRVFDEIPSEKEWYELKGSGHSFATDCQGAEAFEKIASWLDAHI